MGHHILQLHHGVMSGKIQTGQKPLTKQQAGKARGTNGQKKWDRMTKKKQRKRREQNIH